MLNSVLCAKQQFALENALIASIGLEEHIFTIFKIQIKLLI